MAQKTISIYGPIRIDPPIKPRKDDKEARKRTGTSKGKTTGKKK